MYCCNKCFISTYLNSVVVGISRSNGNCSFCKSTGTALIEPKTLLQFFKNIFDLYQVDKDGDEIGIQIQKDFPNKLFTFDDNIVIKELLYNIIIDEIDNYKELFDNKIILSLTKLPSDEIPGNNLNLHWDKFSNEIKNENRFHIKNSMDLNLLKKLLFRHSYSLNAGNIFFRGRISDIKGFTIKEMFNPPKNLTTAGRANPNGISYLYLASDEETTLYETRSSLYDYITVGKFRLLTDIKLINLRETNIFDPIPLSEKEELSDFMLHLPFINTLEDELSKPIRRYDSDLDYLPTQYICEFIKSSNFDGVVYKSSLNPNGYNIAIFTPAKFECISCQVHEINAIKYTHNTI